MTTKCLPPSATSTNGERLSHPAVNPETSVVLAVFPSASKPGSAHAVARSHRTGDVWCTCPAWRFQRIPAGDRVCKHIKRIAASSLSGNGPMAPSAAGQELALAPKRTAKAKAAHVAYRAGRSTTSASL